MTARHIQRGRKKGVGKEREEEDGDGVGEGRRECEMREGYISLMPRLCPRGEGLVTFGRFFVLH